MASYVKASSKPIASFPKKSLLPKVKAIFFAIQAVI